MFPNYLKIAWRNFIKDRQFTLLNLIGLSTGLACSLLIYLWIIDEIKVDKYNETDIRLYQVMTNQKNDDGIKTGEFTPGLLAKALKQEIPEIDHAASVLPASWFPFKGILSTDDAGIKAAGEYVSNEFFDVFTCKYIQGDKQRLFADKYSIAISEELAKKLFHTTNNIIGKTLKWDQQEMSGNFVVSGIFEKNPPSATNQFDALFNYDLVLDKRPTLLDWRNSDPHTYAVVKEGTDINRLNKKISSFIQTKNTENGNQIFLTKYSDKYLNGRFENGKQVGGRMAYVRMFSIIAIVILIIACINFMNLSTAKASLRTKEVGIKKVSGARRGTLILQYLTESMMMTFISLVIALGIISALLPVFNQITGKELSLSYDYKLILSITIITLVTSILAGAYPAFYLSGFKPAMILKGKLRTSFGELIARKGLVVFQFTLSIVFIACVLVIYKQINFIQSKNLGYSRDNVVHFEIPFDMDSARISAAESFVKELRNIPGVINTSSYYHNLTGDHGAISDFHWPGKDPNMNIEFANLEVGSNFLETIGIAIKDGRNFSPNANAANEIIFNESAIRAMGLKDPVGKTIKFWGMERQIVGVAADFNFESLYQQVKPCFFQIYPVLPNVLVKIKAGTEKQTLDKIRQAYTSFNHGLAFDYKFLDEDYNTLYASEQRVALLSRYFAGLAIIISCLGLFGLAAFTAQRRQKEIGIRKVVGASVNSITMMLSKDFLKLVFIALVIAIPFAWWAMNEWLQSFAYRISVGAGVFVFTAAAVLLITLLTTSFQSIKAAIANPVKSLRSE